MVAFKARREKVRRPLFIIASFIAVSGLLLIAFPGVAKKWADAQRRSAIREVPESIQLNSLGSFRALGAGLLVVAAITAWYASKMPSI
jgi:hypothetical protein